MLAPRILIVISSPLCCNLRALDSVFLSVSLIAAHLRGAEDSPRTRRALADYWQRLAYGLYPDAPDLRRQAEDRVREFGGLALLRPETGGRERAVAAVLGWKLARRALHMFS
jgi:hypothetical protein